MVDFRIRVIVDPGGAQRGVRDVRRGLERTTNAADRLRGAVFRAFGAFTAGVGVVQAVRTLADFGQAMSTVRAITQATEADFDRLSETARRLGATTRFSATQAAEGMVFLARAGFDTEQVLGTIEGTLRLAQAGALDLGQAADIASNVLQGFRLNVDQTARVVDVLAFTANNANTTVGQLGDGLKFVAPIAAGLGVPLEESAAAMAALSNAGLQASLAGTGLRRVLAGLESPSDVAAEIFAELGVSLDQIRPSTVGLTEALRVLREAGVDTGQALEIFGQRGGPAFEVLSSSIADVEKMTEALDGAGGTAERVARVMDDNLREALFSVASAFEALILALGEQDDAVDGLEGGVRSLADGLRFLARNADSVGNAITILSGAIVARFVPAMAAATASFVAANPVLLVFAGVATGASIVLGQLSRVARDAAERFDELEEASRAPLAGLIAEIRGAQNQIDRLNQIQERQGGLSDSQREALERLTSAMEDAQQRLLEQRQGLDKVREAREEATAGIEQSISSLDEEIARLSDFSREAEITRRAQEELAKLESAGGDTEGLRQEIEDRLRLIASLEDQRRVLEDIRGPQEQFRRDSEALRALLARGIITVGEFNAKLSELRGQIAEDIGQGFETALEALTRLNDEQQRQLDQGDLAAEALRIENQLRREGVEINDDIQKQIVTELLRKRELRMEEERRTDAAREALGAERRRLSILQQLQGPEEARIQRARDLNFLLDQGEIKQDKFNAAVARARLVAQESSNALEDGFSRAFEKLGQEAGNFAAAAERVVNVFANEATEAITEFARTGEFDFRKFADNVIQEITRILVRLLVVRAISAAAGVPLGGAAGGAGAGQIGSIIGGVTGRQAGGPVTPNEPFVVGERGPELFVPSRGGMIMSNEALQQQRPELNVQVVTVASEDEVPRAIAAGRADEVILNVLSRNADRVRQVVA